MWEKKKNPKPNYQLLVLFGTSTPRCRGFHQPGASSLLNDTFPLAAGDVGVRILHPGTG